MAGGASERGFIRTYPVRGPLTPTGDSVDRFPAYLHSDKVAGACASYTDPAFSHLNLCLISRVPKIFISVDDETAQQLYQLQSDEILWQDP